MLQSGFRPGHSTESAVLYVLSDVLLAVDRGDLAALALLDLSAAFNTVDYNILLQRLQTSYGINGSALQWFRSYLVGQTQRVRHGATISSAVHLVCGVPQGSVTGPILFVLYTADLIALVKSYGLSPHLYADDNSDLWLLLSITCGHVPVSSQRLCQRCSRLDAIQSTAA